MPLRQTGGYDLQPQEVPAPCKLASALRERELWRCAGRGSTAELGTQLVSVGECGSEPVHIHNCVCMHLLEWAGMYVCLCGIDMHVSVLYVFACM